MLLHAVLVNNSTNTNNTNDNILMTIIIPNCNIIILVNNSNSSTLGQVTLMSGLRVHSQKKKSPPYVTC